MNVSIHLLVRSRLIERIDACTEARGLTRRDFIVFAVEREVSQIEARLARRTREAREAGRATSCEPPVPSTGRTVTGAAGTRQHPE